MGEHWEKLFDDAHRENGRGNVARADALVLLAIKEAEDLPADSPSFSSAQCSFALWQYGQERFAEAEIFQKKHIEAEKRCGIGERELANLTLWLAEMQMKQGKLDEAKSTIECAIERFPAGYLPELSGAYEDLASVEELMGDANGAFAARRKSVELRKEWNALVESRKSTLPAP